MMSMLSQSVNNDSMTINVSSANSALTSTATGGSYTTTAGGWVGDSKTTCWNYWQDYYYPYVIRESYPVYVQERAIDKGKKAFEIIKILKDKKLVNIDKVVDFITLMDELIKIL